MARVSDQTIIDAWVRQEGVCAICGEPLDENPYEAHHLVRVADGGSDSADNIVLLCDRDEHEYVHGGNFRSEIAMTADQYPYFNGKSGHLEYEDIHEDEKRDASDDTVEAASEDDSIDDHYNEGGNA